MADSKTTKKLSPSVLSSRPPKLRNAARSSVRCADRASPYRSPRRLTSAVDPSMSLNSIVRVPVGSSATVSATPGPLVPGRYAGRRRPPALAGGTGSRAGADDGLDARRATSRAGLPGLTGYLRIGRQPERLAQRVGELPAAAIPVPGRLGQRPGQHRVRSRRKIRPQGGQRRRRLGNVRVHHRRRLLPVERRHPGQQLERRARQRVLIRPPVHRAAPELLRRDVIQRAQELPGAGQADGRQHRLAQPEIRQVHVIGPPGPRVQQHVGRLDIPVHQPRRVRGIQRRRHRRDDRSRPPRRQRALTAQQRRARRRRARTASR